ncbi:MAG: ABC transporter permease [Planctomycetota bacterium]
MLGQLLSIARNTFLECIRQPVFLVLVLASAILQIFNVAISAYSMGYTEPTEVSGDDKLLLEVGLATVLGIATLLASFLATSVLTREIENKTALTVVSKPIGRPLFIIGKYLGVAAAIVIATTIMLVWFQLAIRHSVMSTARDHYDLPVLLFGSASVFIAIAAGAWCNYFYNMVFASTAVTVLTPMSLVAFLGVLLVDKEWQLQSLNADFKLQITIASFCVILAMLVLSALAVALSTRLKQVMTITACAAVFLLGLLSNYLVGRYAYTNVPVARVIEVTEPTMVGNEVFTFDEPGQEVILQLGNEPKASLVVGTNIYYGPAPSGIRIAVPSQAPYSGDPNDPDDTFRWLTSDEAQRLSGDLERSPAVVIKSYDAENKLLTLVNAGGLDVRRPPVDNRDPSLPTVEEQQRQIDQANENSNDAARPNTLITEIPTLGDFIFLEPTKVNPIAATVWSFVPNLQMFWLSDAITQGHAIPIRYILQLLGYTLSQVVALIALAIILFQKRDMG